MNFCRHSVYAERLYRRTIRFSHPLPPSGKTAIAAIRPGSLKTSCTPFTMASTRSNLLLLKDWPYSVFIQPKEIKDIKRFIEIATRKDAVRASSRPCTQFQSNVEHINRGTDKESCSTNTKWQSKDKVQDSMHTLPIHLLSRWPREGQQATAESSTRCVLTLILSLPHLIGRHLLQVLQWSRWRRHPKARSKYMRACRHLFHALCSLSSSLSSPLRLLYHHRHSAWELGGNLASYVVWECMFTLSHAFMIYMPHSEGNPKTPICSSCSPSGTPLPIRVTWPFLDSALMLGPLTTISLGHSTWGLRIKHWDLHLKYIRYLDLNELPFNGLGTLRKDRVQHVTFGFFKSYSKFGLRARS